MRANMSLPFLGLVVSALGGDSGGNRSTPVVQQIIRCPHVATGEHARFLSDVVLQRDLADVVRRTAALVMSEAVSDGTLINAATVRYCADGRRRETLRAVQFPAHRSQSSGGRTAPPTTPSASDFRLPTALSAVLDADQISPSLWHFVLVQLREQRGLPAAIVGLIAYWLVVPFRRAGRDAAMMLCPPKSAAVGDSPFQLGAARRGAGGSASAPGTSPLGPRASPGGVVVVPPESEIQRQPDGEEEVPARATGTQAQQLNNAQHNFFRRRFAPSSLPIRVGDAVNPCPHALTRGAVLSSPERLRLTEHYALAEACNGLQHAVKRLAALCSTCERTARAAKERCWSEEMRTARAAKERCWSEACSGGRDGREGRGAYAIVGVRPLAGGQMLERVRSGRTFLNGQSIEGRTTGVDGRTVDGLSGGMQDFFAVGEVVSKRKERFSDGSAVPYRMKELGYISRLWGKGRGSWESIGGDDEKLPRLCEAVWREGWGGGAASSGGRDCEDLQRGAAASTPARRRRSGEDAERLSREKMQRTPGVLAAENLRRPPSRPGPSSSTVVTEDPAGTLLPDLLTPYFPRWLHSPAGRLSGIPLEDHTTESISTVAGVSSSQPVSVSVPSSEPHNSVFLLGKDFGCLDVLVSFVQDGEDHHPNDDGDGATTTSPTLERRGRSWRESDFEPQPTFEGCRYVPTAPGRVSVQQQLDDDATTLSMGGEEWDAVEDSEAEERRSVERLTDDEIAALRSGSVLATPAQQTPSLLRRGGEDMMDNDHRSEDADAHMSTSGAASQQGALRRRRPCKRSRSSTETGAEQSGSSSGREGPTPLPSRPQEVEPEPLWSVQRQRHGHGVSPSQHGLLTLFGPNWIDAKNQLHTETTKLRFRLDHGSGGQTVFRPNVTFTVYESVEYLYQCAVDTTGSGATSISVPAPTIGAGGAAPTGGGSGDPGLSLQEGDQGRTGTQQGEQREQSAVGECVRVEARAKGRREKVLGRII